MAMTERAGSGLCAEPQAHTAPEMMPKRGGRSVTEAQEFAAGFVGDVNGEEVRSSHAVDWLAECFAEQGEWERAKECLEAFPVVRAGIELVLDDKLTARAKQEKTDEARRQLNQLHQKRG